MVCTITIVKNNYSIPQGHFRIYNETVCLGIIDIKGLFFAKKDCLLQRIPDLQLVKVDFRCGFCSG